MKYENDFVDETPVEMDIGGRRFLYKPTTGGDENEWLKDIMGVNPETKLPQIDWGEYNKKKLVNILETPYTKEDILRVIGVAKPWQDLISDDRYRFIGKLRPSLFDQIISAIKNIDEPDKKAVKNSQG